MRVENRFYESSETVEYHGRALKAPNCFKDFLTEKYGDWSVPVKEWSCSEHELTIYTG
jgi:lipopolysaccharide cholinephosphotransferase